MEPKEPKEPKYIYTDIPVDVKCSRCHGQPNTDPKFPLNLITVLIINNRNSTQTLKTDSQTFCSQLCLFADLMQQIKDNQYVDSSWFPIMQNLLIELGKNIVVNEDDTN